MKSRGSMARRSWWIAVALVLACVKFHESRRVAIGDNVSLADKERIAAAVVKRISTPEVHNQVQTQFGLSEVEAASLFATSRTISVSGESGAETTVQVEIGIGNARSPGQASAVCAYYVKIAETEVNRALQRGG